MANIVNKIVNEARTLMGGMNKDSTSSAVPKNQYIEAESIKLSEPTENSLGGINVAVGNTEIITLPVINITNNSDDYKGYRIALNIGATTPAHIISISGVASAAMVAAGVTNALRYADLVTKVNAQITALGFTGRVYRAATSTTPDLVHIGIKIYGSDVTVTETIGGIAVDTQIIKEFLGNTNNGAFTILKSYDYVGQFFYLATNGYVLQWWTGSRNDLDGTWATPILLFQTKQIQLAKTLINLLDLDMCINYNYKLSAYFTAEGVLPRCIYTFENQYSTMSCFLWSESYMAINTELSNPYGYYVFESVEKETRLQVLENLAIANFVSMQDGGSLSAGDKMYMVRQSIGLTISTGFNIVSNPINVMSQDLTDTTIHGNTGGYPTSKSIALNITGLNPTLYDYFDLAVVENIDGAMTAKVVNTYTITGTSQTVIHTGNEKSTLLALADIVTNQIMIRDAKNLVLNRNRLFLSNITTQNDRNFASFFASGAVTVATNKTTLPAIGKNYDNVAEYQLPANVNQKTGYMLNETYRLGAVVIDKQGYVSSAYYITDWLCQFGGSAALTNDVSAGVQYPTSVYVYHPQVTINYSTAPTINGNPFLSEISAISIVRQECIPEVLASGYVMGACYENATSYTVGQYAAAIEASATPAFSDPRKAALLSPDVLFGNQSIVYEGGDKLKVADAVYYYNDIEKFPADPLNKVFLNEFGSYVKTGFSDITITNSENVPFNSTGAIQMNGKTLSTSVTSFQTGCQQRCIALQLAADLPTPSVGNGGMFYAQYFRNQGGGAKYGDTNQGNYISCGHFQPASAITLTGFAMDVYGGDTFIQKNFTKFVNKEVFDLYSVTFSGVASIVQAAGTYNYIIVATNGGTPICQSNTYSFIVGSGDTLKAHLIQWDSVVNATDYIVYVQIPGGSWYRHFMADATITYLYDAGITFYSTTAPTNTTLYELSVGLSYYTENRNNYQMRYFPITDNTSYPYTTQDINVWLTPTSGNDLVEGTLRYSQSYTPLNTFQPYQAFNSNLFISETIKQPSTVYYSQETLLGGAQDALRVILPLNFKSYPQIYGQINNTFAEENYLFILTNSAAITQNISLQALGSTSNQQTFILGDASVLGSQEAINTNYGSQYKTGAVKYLSSTGKWYVSWFDFVHKKWFRRGADGIRDLGKENVMQSFLYANNNGVTNASQIALGYDMYSDELLICINAGIPSGATEYNGNFGYSIGDKVYITSVDGGSRTYYIALETIPTFDGAQPPNSPEGQLQKWAIDRQSNYILAFNEKFNNFSTFYPYFTKMFMPYKNTFLTFYTTPASFPTASSFIYEHNKGSVATWYGMIARTPYLKTVFNEIPEVFKTMKRLFLKCIKQPYYLHVFGRDGSKTYAVQSDFQQKREFWWVNVKNDATITAGNPTGINSLYTKRTSGETIGVTVFFNSENKMTEIVSQMYEKPRIFNQ